MGTYVIGDIHGCYNEFMTLVEKIDKQDSKAHYILVGDIVDRGPDTYKLLQWAMKNVNKQSSRFEMVIGNHEFDKIYILERWIEKPESIDYLIEHYNFNYIVIDNELGIDDLKDICEFFKNLPPVISKDIEVEFKLTKDGIKQCNKRKQHYIIAHSKIITNNKFLTTEGKLRKNINIKHKEIDDIVWHRDTHRFGYSYKSNYIHNSIVIHGHTPTISLDDFGAEPGKIDYTYHDINIDCGLVYECDASNLAAIRLDDLKEFYLHDIEDNQNKRIINIKNKNTAIEEFLGILK